MSVIFVADLHLKANRLHNQRTQSRLQAVANRYPGSTLCVLGDITDNGSAEEWLEATRILSLWSGNLLICKGNHDIGAPFGFIQEDRSEMRFQDFCAVMGCDGERLVGSRPVCMLDSVRSEGDGCLLAEGELGEAELERARLFVERWGDKAVLCLHHNPFLEENEEFAMVLKDRKKLLDIAYGAGRLIYGHTHRRETPDVYGSLCLYTGLDAFGDAGDYLIIGDKGL